MRDVTAPTVADALAAATRPPAPATPPRRRHPVLLAGGGGAMGAAVLEALLAHGGFDGIRVLARRPMASLAHGVTAVDHRRWLDEPGTDDPPVAVMVIDRPRAANGREAAFWQPTPADLLPLARRLGAPAAEPASPGASGDASCRPARLLVVEPIDAARWPQALREGLATLDEQAAAGLGLGALVFVRPAAAPAAARAQGPQRVADAVLGTLRLMLPGSLQPVRIRTLAAVVARIAARIAEAEPGTRVLGPESLWQAAQSADPAGWAEAWLAGRTPPPVRLRPGRM